MSNLDSERLQRALNGDAQAFAMIVETYQNPVYNLCYRMLGNEQDAEDAAQETFWRAFQALSKYDRSRSFITWLLSIAAHYCIDQHRRKKIPNLEIDDALEEVISDGMPTPETAYHLTEEERRLHRLLNELGPQDRAAVILRYWYDYSEQEISETLSLSISAVKSRLFRARQQLARGWQTTEQETTCMVRS